ncbi:alcohol dehydrogenase class IV [Catenibacillus scindens]|uniref:Alcohol dehydrogenase class IV n=1 Tax=Catenibacillus scindens TaxID=673271 RepID=A0A7W8HD29_9FIRM|nr:iron-containing alcohol dehydrogenase [Catenibacillus scindens]MBB5266104.1 alcohol dehydrogenase class IV [Catenibacillus scindens]
MAHFAIPSHIFIGNTALAEAMPYIKEWGGRAFIVTGKHVGKSPMMQQLKKALEGAQIPYYVFDGITGEPTDAMIETGLALYKKTGCQFVIGIGGGSPLDSAKAIAAMAVGDGKIADYNGKEMTGKTPGIVAIPTTSGTGSEATRFTIITDQDKDIKMLLKGDCLVPDIAVVNSDFTIDMPKSVTAATGLDALTHAVEAYTSKKASPLTDILAVDAVTKIMKYLPAVYANGYDAAAREEMSIAALEGGICINNSSVTLVHGMSRPIGALFHVPHGLSNAMLLKECLGFAMDGAWERFGALGRAIGAATDKDCDETAAKALLKEIEKLCQICEVPTLRDYGIEEDAFYPVIEKMAEDAVASGSPANTRKTVTKEDCMELYRKIYDGT